VHLKSSLLSIICFIICNFLILIGNLDFNYASSDQISLNQITTDWLDIRSVLSDVGVFIIVGILSFIGFYIRQYFVNNGKWKTDREDFEKSQAYTNQSIANAVKLIVEDLKQYKETNSKEIDEIRSDYKAVNNKAIQNEERINGLKENIDYIRKNN
jgi:hypothetical protein